LSFGSPPRFPFYSYNSFRLPAHPRWQFPFPSRVFFITSRFPPPLNAEWLSPFVFQTCIFVPSARQQCYLCLCKKQIPSSLPNLELVRGRVSLIVSHQLFAFFVLLFPFFFLTCFKADLLPLESSPFPVRFLLALHYIMERLESFFYTFFM